MASSTNKWASRAVVILQLAAWSAVGVVLLQKGVSSLQKGPEIRNTSLITPEITLQFNSQTSDKDLSVIPIVDQQISLNPNGQQYSDYEIKKPLSNLNIGTLQDDTKVFKNDLSTLMASDMSKLNFSMKLTDAIKQISMEASRETSGFREESPHTSTNQVDTLTDVYIDQKTTTSPPVRSGIWESRRKVRLSHLSSGGAAAAVAMVAVGAVMLVLGPAVIILRALDERRQERRFLKLSGRDDLPPTYEQATLMDEAPRYSSLSLNTILGPPPPPSPVPVRVHLV